MATSTRKSMKKVEKRKNLADQSVEDFMDAFDDASESSDASSLASPAKKMKKKGDLKKQKTQEKSTVQTKDKKGNKVPGKSPGVLAKHKSSLDKLKDQDPEFYEFLKKEDQSLLNFDVPDSDYSDTDDENDDQESDSGSIDEQNSDEEDIDIPMSSSDDNDDVEGVVGSKKNVGKKDKLLGKKKEQEKKTAKIAEKAEKATEKKKKDDKNTGKKQKVADTKKNKEEEEGSDDDFDNFSETDSEDDEDKEDMFHKPPETLETMSDQDSDVDLDDDDDGDDDDDDDDAPKKKIRAPKGTKVTQAMIDNWTQRLKDQPSPTIIATVAQVLKAAVQKTSRDTEATKYVVQGGTVFNGIVRMCLVEMPPALHKVLNLPTTTDLEKPTLPSTNDKRWIKVKTHVKWYLTDILKLMSDISEVSMVNVLLKHIHKLVAFIACDKTLTKAVLKKAINIWSTGEETSRVLAFLILNRLVKIYPEVCLESSIKSKAASANKMYVVMYRISVQNCQENVEKMLVTRVLAFLILNRLVKIYPEVCFESSIKKLYMAYVRNCKFTSPNTLPHINFMQRSYVEIISIDMEMAYQYAFMYIRQLAIHLRTATSTKKKESCQAVYNWQYIHCLSLWSRVMSMTFPNEVLEPLIYPLIQTIIGTIKLIPTQRYYPLRFHCVQSLTMISKSTNIYIPVLPFLLEVFEQTDFNKRHKAINFKPYNFACILKFSKAQIQERAFKDGLIDMLFELLLEFFAAHAHSVGFPELVLPAQFQLKDFLKQCKVGNFTKQIKQIYDKVCENSNFITARRNKTAFNLSDTKSIDIWERECKEAGTPIGKYYVTWRKLRDRELMHKIADKEQIIGGDKIPEVVLPRQPQKATEEDKKEFAALFDSDSEEEKIDFSESFLPPTEKRKLQKKKEKAEGKKGGKKKTEESDSDDYSDFDSDEMEQLAGSADDDDDDDDDENDDGGEAKGSNDDDVDSDESDADDDEDDVDGNDDDDDQGADDDDDDDDIGDAKDIVEDFTMSSDED